MECKQAQQLFDAYLDGELSDSLATELGAHRVHCPECRRALALLEVSGHIIGSDREAPPLSSDFTDRLLACMESPKSRSLIHQLWHWRYVAGPLAAAAVVAFAIVYSFGGSEQQVAGVEESASSMVETADEDDSGLKALADRLQADIQSSKRSRDSLEQAINLPAARLRELLAEENGGIGEADPGDERDTGAESTESMSEDSADTDGA